MGIYQSESSMELAVNVSLQCGMHLILLHLVIFNSNAYFEEYKL
jgi:hypothetical protein